MFPAAGNLNRKNREGTQRKFHHGERQGVSGIEIGNERTPIETFSAKLFQERREKAKAFPGENPPRFWLRSLRLCGEKLHFKPRGT